MLAEPIYRNGYVLPPFTHFYPRAGGKKEGSYSVVNDKNQKVAKLIFSNNKLNGVCLFYDSNGMVKEKFTYVNDAIDGWGYIYDNGVKVNCYLYKMGVLEMALNQEPGMDGYFRQIDVPNNIVNGIYKFDDTCVKYGIGYEFKNNSIAAVKQYKNGKEVMKLKEMNNGIMVEYDSNGTKVYEGTFKDSLNEGFPRNGHGKEFNRDELLYEGNWENGKKSGRGNSYLRGSLVYSGTWQNNLPNDEGTLMDDGDVKYQGRWVDGKFRVGEYDYYDYSTNSVVQNASATPGYSPSQTPQGKYQAPYGVSIPLSPLSTADPGILPSGGLDLNNIPQTIPMSAITTPAMQTPYVGGYPAMAPQAVVAPGPSYIMPVYPQESIPSSAVVAKPVVVQAEPISYITGQVKPLEKAGSSKKKRIALIISLILLIILLIAGVIVFIWYRTTPTITVRNYEDLKNLDWRVGELIIPANSYNEYSDISFTLSGFERLTKITIKDASCRDVKFFSLEDLPALKTIIVGRESFNNQNNWKDGISYDSSRSVSIVNCPSLTTITFGVGSFVAFSSLKLKELPKLTTITMGVVSEDSSCFYYGSLILEDLPRLESITVGMWAFACSPEVSFVNLPSLREITAGEYAMACLWDYSTLIMRDLPSLRTIVGGDYTFAYLYSVVFYNVPSVTKIDLYYAFALVNSCSAQNAGVLAQVCEATSRL